MIKCPTCGRLNANDFLFCPQCGSKLGKHDAGAVRRTRVQGVGQTSHHRLPLTEERKVVTAVFCDLVGYTSHSEVADHELIDELLHSYSALARELVESYGGVVEKFIGDAVLAVFGFPHSHDDDAERAVRVGLRLVDEASRLTWPDGEPVQVRVGVNSGETYVRTDVDPGSGETFLTGDAVNTAARLETAAPPESVVVGELTHRLSKRHVVYEEIPSLTLKGKSRPVRAWLARRVRADAASIGYPTHFIGRDSELEELKRLFELSADTGRSQIALVVGEPGIGKSRLVAEFGRWLEERHEQVTWREGRCLPYGDGVSLWALAEIVKTHIGLLDTDSEAVAAAKLEGALPPGDDAGWLAGRLRPLLGLETTQGTREESFTAWRHFLEHLAVDGPAVLVFEDLHWADDMMLAFVGDLLAKTSEVPLLILGTARTVLFEQRPSFAQSAVRLDLSGLTSNDLSALVAGLLATPETPPEIESLLVERCAGNPLYAEEYVRLLTDRGLLDHEGAALRLKSSAVLPLPDSLQAVIAARLDTLPLDRKALLMDAAVLGRSFWSGAVKALSGVGSTDVQQALAALCSTELIREATTSTMAGETEYLFWHVLARDVAYAELPRRERATKHAAAGAWLEAKAGERARDIGDVLAHHYTTALELAEARNDEQLAQSLIDPAVRGLSLAAERMERLDLPASGEYYRRAYDLTKETHPRHWKLLKGWGSSLLYTGKYEEAYGALERAVDGFKTARDWRQAADTLMYLATAANELSRSDPSLMVEDALALLADDEPSPELVSVLECLGDVYMMRGDWETQLRVCDQALAYAEQIGISDEAWQALDRRGFARCQLGDLGGLEDAERATELWRSPMALLDLASLLNSIRGPLVAAAKNDEAIAAARRRGEQRTLASAIGNRVDLLRLAGLWDDALAAALDLEEIDGRVTSPARASALFATCHIMLARGQVADAEKGVESLRQSLAGVESDGYQKSRIHAMLSQAEAAMAVIRETREEAREALEHLLSSRDPSENTDFGPEAMRIALWSGDEDLAERLAKAFDGPLPLSQHVHAAAEALLFADDGRQEAAALAFADAASRWREFGVPYEEGQALLGQGRCLMALDRDSEAAEPLVAAREIFARLGAKPALAETEGWLAKTN